MNKSRNLNIRSVEINGSPADYAVSFINCIHTKDTKPFTAHICVEFFFMISGYYLIKSLAENKISNGLEYTKKE